MGCSIAVVEILRRLASQFVLSVCLTDFFLPHIQVGVGIPGGLEAAIQAVRHSLSVLGTDDSLALLNIYIYEECI